MAFSRIFYSILLLFFPVFPSNGQKSTQKCQQLVHLGDSTTLSMQNYLKNDYKSMGFTNVIVDATNGGSIWYPNGYSGVEKVRKYKKPGTCWVIALGTNDSASTSHVNWQPRFDSIMDVIGTDPVMWVNVWYNSSTRPNYNVFVATGWNAFLIRNKTFLPTITIYDWATTAKSHPEWFLSDGLHYTDTGSKQRSYWVSRMASFLLH